MTDTTAAAAECIICSAAVSEPGSDYYGEVCRQADATGEQLPDWD
ncbi:hypothetical protein ACFV1N_25265 [Streptosporangium canum]